MHLSSVGQEERVLRRNKLLARQLDVLDEGLPRTVRNWNLPDSDGDFGHAAQSSGISMTSSVTSSGEVEEAGVQVLAYKGNRWRQVLLRCETHLSQACMGSVWASVLIRLIPIDNLRNDWRRTPLAG